MSMLLPRTPLLRRVLSLRSNRFIFAIHIRKYSPIASHSSFPATLYHFNQGPRSNLFDYDAVSQEYRDTKYGSDGVKLATDGLVHPAVYRDMPFANGALFMPNTFNMQEHVRMFYDYYLEDVEGGKSIEKPLLFRIAKGTQLPTSMTLFNDFGATFSLQPSRGISLQSLNETLDEFYSKCAEKHDLDQWLIEHKYAAAIDDAKTEKWMGV
ncbi:uncharacterized protein BDR25DRAFT_270374 [Lindgomyces ingoldianus]|uniref:Uncharacterized protein n=1 Tax=Lindgomyces ingoldianus TaxID=673940 RepID=A0ACB6QDZ5_9PLEO|nr:uncharacterized protein BDR25DRAFT_270374 [Lindgomyces ingoldianus]KAF2465254.1 hypothetical protein BDR25DRAFT_270374 [Lindgomyces ingoldianus]